jgi:ribosomal protein S17E
MTKEQLDEIVKEQPNLNNLPNNLLVKYMDLLTDDFESTKKNIIAGTIYLDKVEMLYNNILKIYNDRGNG